jgi:peptidoglycan/xylan/chitin deacetylase (PgdA/CDA1 family)
MTLLKADAKTKHAFHRHVLSAAFLLLCVVSTVLVIEHSAQRPHFVLDEDHASIARLPQHDWRGASDWIAGRKYALLTFDDGPYGHGLDEKILGILRKHHAHAIFFIICNHLDTADAGLLGEFERNGHLIGNHSYDHLKLTTLSTVELHQQIEGCSQRIARSIGHRPFYFRPPFGMTSLIIKQSAKASGMHQMLWNANSGDWSFNRQKIHDLTLAETDDQSIVLMHERPRTAEALDETLTDLEKRGFEFVLPDQQPGESRID